MFATVKGLSQVEAQNQDSPFRCPLMEPKQLCHYLLTTKVAASEAQSSQDSKQALQNRMWASQVAAEPTLPQYPPCKVLFNEQVTRKEKASVI